MYQKMYWNLEITVIVNPIVLVTFDAARFWNKFFFGGVPTYLYELVPGKSTGNHETQVNVRFGSRHILLWGTCVSWFPVDFPGTSSYKYVGNPPKSRRIKIAPYRM